MPGQELSLIIIALPYAVHNAVETGFQKVKADSLGKLITPGTKILLVLNVCMMHHL